MAETKRMTSEQVVGYLLEGEGVDFLRESLSWVVQQLMEAEVSDLVGAGRGERAPEERLTHRNGYRARPWATRAGELELAIPKLRRGSYFPSFLEPRRPPSRRWSQWCRRRTSPACRRARSIRWSSRLVADLEERGVADLRRSRRAGRRPPQPPARGPLSVPVAGREGREGARLGPRRAQGAGARLWRARVRLPRGDRARRRRGRDGGLLAQLPARPGRARPRRRAAGRLRRARRSEEGDRAAARLPLAALQRPLPARSTGPRPPRAAADGGRAAAPALRRRQRRPGTRARRRGARQIAHAAAEGGGAARRGRGGPNDAIGLRRAVHAQQHQGGSGGHRR